MMNRPYNMFAKGGLRDEGGEIDEVSGNKVPVGGTKEGVRDDIDANLSVGEFVMPEDATRYHGLKTMMQMRQEAKMGLKQMEAMGLMGNADEAILPDDIPFGLGDLMIVEVDDSGLEREVNMAAGGMAFNRGGTTDQSGETISLTGGTQPVPVRDKGEVSFDDVMADAKLEFKEYRNDSGASIMIPFRGGIPMFPIPEGYKLYTGEDGEAEVPDVPETGEGVLPSDDDDSANQAALTAYRQSGKSTQVNWEDMSTEEFLQKANERNGFGRNLAMGVASMINPIAAIGMSALLQMEDKKVLSMARERMKALPAGSAQRAEYEKMVAAYEDRGKGLFGGIIGNIADKIGDLLGLSEAEKQRGKNSNMVSHSRDLPNLTTADGQVTEAGAEAVNTGNIPIFGTAGVTANQIEESINTIANPQGKTPEQIQNAKNIAANVVGAELGSWVDPAVMNAVQQGIGDRTPEQTRQDLVNIAYQPASDLEGQIKALSPTQQAFLGYDAKTNNYLDVIDTAREQVSQITPIDATVQAPTQNITRDFTTTATQTQEQARQDQITALIDAGTPPAVAAASVPMVNVPQVTVTDKPDANAVEGPEAAGGAVGTPIYNDQGQLVGIKQPEIAPAQSYATMDMGEAGRTTVQNTVDPDSLITDVITTKPPVTDDFAPDKRNATNPRIGYESGQDTQQSLPSYITSPLGVDKQTTEAFMPTGTTTTTTTGTGTGRDVADMPVTGEQVAYSTSGGGQSKTDKYDPRTVTQVPTEQVTNIPVTATAQMETQQLGTPQAPLQQPSQQSTVGDPYTTATGITPPALPTLDTVTKPAMDLTKTYTDTSSLAGIMEASGLSTTDTGTPEAFIPSVTKVTPSQEIQDAVTPSDIKYDEFGDLITPTAEETKSKPLTLKDVVPDAKTTEAQTFDEAFDAARKAGLKTFPFQGKQYTTELATNTGTSAKKEEKKTQGKYDPTANKQLSAGFTNNTLSQAEQDAFDAAVDSGDANVANHYASINRLRNKQDAYAESGFDPAVGASLGLSTNDMEQAEKYGGSVQTAINEGRAESQGFLKPAKVTDTSKSKDSGSTATTTTKSTSAKTSSSKDSGSSGTTSTIKSGDTLSKIAKDNGTTVAEIMKANPDIKDANKIQAGASITIPKKSSGGGGSSNNDDGGGGGGASNDTSCVIATHGISTGGFSLREKAKAEIWCERTYHGKWYGEAFRRGYRHAGTKAIERGEAQKHYQEFKDFVAYGRGLKKDWKSAVNYYKRTAQFFLTGLFVK